jgi:SAM-dependent methyltransferase
MSDFNILSKVLVENFHPKLVLDVGCGSGSLVLKFQEQGVNAIGCDISRDALSVNKKARPYLLLSRAENLPFKEKIFDLIVYHHVVEHLSNFSFIEEAKKILKNGGVIYIETPLPPFEAKRLWARVRIKRPALHINLHTRSFWIKIFESYGFQFMGDLEEVLGYDQPSAWFRKLLWKLGTPGKRLWRRYLIGAFLFKLEEK